MRAQHQQRGAAAACCCCAAAGACQSCTAPWPIRCTCNAPAPGPGRPPFDDGVSRCSVQPAAVGRDRQRLDASDMLHAWESREAHERALRRPQAAAHTSSRPPAAPPAHLVAWGVPKDDAELALLLLGRAAVRSGVHGRRSLRCGLLPQLHHTGGDHVGQAERSGAQAAATSRGVGRVDVKSLLGVQGCRANGRLCRCAGQLLMMRSSDCDLLCGVAASLCQQQRAQVPGATRATTSVADVRSPTGCPPRRCPSHSTTQHTSPRPPC